MSSSEEHPKKRVVVTGATGLLGRAVMRVLKASGSYECVGLGFARADGKEVLKADLRDGEAVRSLLVDELQPFAIIHAAAERRPDVCKHDVKATEALNVDACATLAKAASQCGAHLIAMSTDYVFDGTDPPYSVSAVPKPLNTYGRSKCDGEAAVLEGCELGRVLRVPVLYSDDVHGLDESAITTIIAQVVRAREAGEVIQVDNYARRFPTHTQDVAEVLKRLVVLLDTETSQDPLALPRVWHFSSRHVYTKYEVAKMVCKALGGGDEVLEPKNEPDKDAAPRPLDSQLDTSESAQFLGELPDTELEPMIASLVDKFVVQE